MTQRRWLCHDCGREYVYVRDWDERRCPLCRSEGIERVEYQAAFPGGDIPKPASKMSSDEIVAEIHATLATLVGEASAPEPSKNLQIQLPPAALVAAEEERNWAVELSGGWQ